MQPAPSSEASYYILKINKNTKNLKKEWKFVTVPQNEMLLSLLKRVQEKRITELFNHKSLSKARCHDDGSDYWKN
jgi:succinate dehydrogenase/fumarate reductase-like Fe-S protein